MLKHLARSLLQVCFFTALGFWLLFGGCSEGFQVKNGRPSIVSITGAGKTIRSIPGADADTFKALDNAENARVIYAVDAKHVYMGLTNMAMVIDSADPGSFSILTSDGTYAKDKNHVYWFGVELNGADPGTFRIIKAPFTVDSQRAYAGTTPIEIHSLEEFEVLEVSGVDSPIINRGNQLTVQPGREYVSGWARDGIAYYWGSSELKGADYNSLVILNDLHAKDNKTVYFRGKPILSADAESFTVVGPGGISGQDKNYRYEKGKRTGPVENNN